MSPKFVVYTRQSSKLPLFLETLRTKPEDIGSVDVNLLNSTFIANKDIIQNECIGYLPGFFKNDSEIKGTFSVVNLNECFEQIREDIKSVYIG